jgi:hypothetical protein
VGNDSDIAFGQKFPGEKGSLRQCVIMVQQPIPLLPELRVKSSQMFTESL